MALTTPLLSVLGKLGSKAKYYAGINPKKVKEGEQIAKSLFEKRREAGLTTPQVYNPLISRKAGRYTGPRVVFTAGLGGTGYALSRGGGDGTTTDAQSAADYLNYMNQMAAEQKLRESFAPQTDYSSFQNILTGLTKDFTPYSAGGGAGTTLGSTSGMYNVSPSDVSGYDTTQSGAVSAGQDYANQIGDIINQYTQNVPKKSAAGTKSGQTINDMVQAAAAMAAISDATQARQDYRDFLLNQIKATGKNPYMSPSFTGQEQGLNTIYDEWTKLTPTQIADLQTNYGVYSPYDLYQLRKSQNPQQFGG